MRRVMLLVGVIITIFMVSVGTVSAETYSEGKNKNIPQEEIDKFLIEIGVPNDVLANMDDPMKLSIYETGQVDKIEFDSSNSEEFYLDELTGELKPVPEFQTMGTIPGSELTVSHDIYSVSISGVKYKRVYARWYWKKSHLFKGTKGDKIAITIPSGWQIKAQSYKCGELVNGIPNTNPWRLKGNCNGGTYDIDSYGAVWSLTGTDPTFHGGWVYLDMKRTSTSAQNKVISKYVKDTGGSTTWSVSWKALSVSISGNKASDQVAWDTPFTY